MEDLEALALEVDSVVDLIVPIADETLDAELAGIQHAFGAMVGSGMGPLHEAVDTRALVETDVWRQISSPGDMAGAGKHSTSLTTTGVSRFSTSR